jgi:hypothetical protein
VYAGAEICPVRDSLHAFSWHASGPVPEENEAAQAPFLDALGCIFPVVVGVRLLAREQ